MKLGFGPDGLGCRSETALQTMTSYNIRTPGHSSRVVTAATARSRTPTAPLLSQAQPAASTGILGVPVQPFQHSCSCEDRSRPVGQPHPTAHHLQQHQQDTWQVRQLGSQPLQHGQHAGLQRQQQQQQQQQRRRRRQQQWQLQVLDDGVDKGSKAQAEPPATSGGPPNDAAGASSSSSSDSSSKPVAGSSSVDDEVDAALEKVWASLKKDLKKELPPEQADMLDKWSTSDIQTDKVFREMANHQLGPFLQSMGIDEDPYEFFLDLFRWALVFQLVAAGLVFYTVELGLGGNVGDAFRAVGGLLLGYTLRLGIKVEQLAWPVYNGLVQLLISEGATYEIPPATAEEQRDTLNKLGVALTAAFLVPKFMFGWQNDECWQIVVPMLGGLFFFDVAYMFGLIIKLGMGGNDEDNKS